MIRAWVEQGSSDPLRAEIRSTTDTARGFSRELVVADAGAASELVAAWLAEVIALSDRS